VDLEKLVSLISLAIVALLATASAVTSSAPVAFAAAAVAVSLAAWTALRPARVPTAAPADPALPAVVDLDTGLPDNHYFDLLLAGRVSTAKRRLWPLALVMVEIESASGVAVFTNLLRLTIREADVACRIGPTTFAVILEDAAEAGGVWTAERIQIAVAKQREASTLGPALRVAAGVASYPSHALQADQLLVAARSALARARGQQPMARGLGAVEVAHMDLS